MQGLSALLGYSAVINMINFPYSHDQVYMSKEIIGYQIKHLTLGIICIA